MIRQSFILLEKVGKEGEKNIWGQGIDNWDLFLKTDKIKGLSKPTKLYYDRQLIRARSSLYNFNSSYFIDKLPQSEMWRLYEFFKDEAVFLDIETSGIGRYDTITVIGLFDGVNTKTMIRSINLDYNYLRRELRKYKIIVTYNGAAFDLPFIKKRHPGILPDIPHFDLKSACDRVGLTGGLKEIEKKMGIKRNQIIEKMHGGDAATLWRMHRATGDEYYLRLLVEYNEEDVINLKTIAEYVVQKLKENSFEPNGKYQQD